MNCYENRIESRPFYGAVCTETVGTGLKSDLAICIFQNKFSYFSILVSISNVIS